LLRLTHKYDPIAIEKSERRKKEEETRGQLSTGQVTITYHAITRKLKAVKKRKVGNSTQR